MRKSGGEIVTYEGALGIGANWAAILTAAIAVWGYASYRRDRCAKKSRLEAYLKAEKGEGKNMGQRSVKHLVANLGISENEVLDAAFHSKNIRCVTTKGGNGFVDLLLLEYTGE